METGPVLLTRQIRFLIVIYDHKYIKFFIRFTNLQSIAVTYWAISKFPEDDVMNLSMGWWDGFNFLISVEAQLVFVECIVRNISKCVGL